MESIAREENIAIRIVAMPQDTNPHGDIFGGWLLSLMDMAGSMIATKEAGGRTATIAINAMTFKKPVKVGDEVTCYAKLKKLGNTSLTVYIEAWSRRPESNHSHLVTEGEFTFVALDEKGHPRLVKV